MTTDLQGTQAVFQLMLDRIQQGEWSPGTELPSERRLIEDLGVSRISLREALSMLKGLGVIDSSHGRRSRVRAADSATLGQLLPLVMAGGGQQTFDQIFEVRLALETMTAGLAAARRKPEHLDRLRDLARRFRGRMLEGAEDEATDPDLGFHLEIARATGNPLFVVLLESLAGFVSIAQRESCRDDRERGLRAVMAHEGILDAIEAGDSDRARAEMEAHLRFSQTRRIAPDAFVDPDVAVQP